MNLPKFLVLLLCLGVLAGWSTRSEACCGDGPVAAQGATAAGATVSSTITTATGTVVSTLQQLNLTVQQGFTSLAMAIQQQTAEQKVQQQGMIAVETARDMTKAKAEAIERYQVSPRACFETAGGAAIASAAGDTAQNADDLNRNAAQRTLYTVNTVADVQQRLRNHFDKYCSAQDAALGRCTAVSSAMQNADVRADALYSNSTLSSDQLTAAQALAQNLVNPMPVQNLPRSAESTHAGKVFIAGQYMEQAGLSVASDIVNHSIAERTPVKGLGTSAMMNTPDISEMGLMEAQVQGRFESPAWYTMLASMSQENLLREMNKQMALKLWMDLKAYKQQERQEAAVATLVALEVRRDAEANLDHARSAALRSQ